MSVTGCLSLDVSPVLKWRPVRGVSFPASDVSPLQPLSGWVVSLMDGWIFQAFPPFKHSPFPSSLTCSFTARCSSMRELLSVMPSGVCEVLHSGLQLAYSALACKGHHWTASFPKVLKNRHISGFQTCTEPWVILWRGWWWGCQCTSERILTFWGVGLVSVLVKTLHNVRMSPCEETAGEDSGVLMMFQTRDRCREDKPPAVVARGSFSNTAEPL